jgi:hypothetical protein
MSRALALPGKSMLNSLFVRTYSAACKTLIKTADCRPNFFALMTLDIKSHDINNLHDPHSKLTSLFSGTCLKTAKKGDSLMYMECRHIKVNGLRCQSPALKSGHFCYYHAKLRMAGSEPELKFGPLQLPAPDDAAAIQLSVARINQAILDGRLDLAKAAALFTGLRIASRFIRRPEFVDPDEVVQSAQQTTSGEELAPDNYVCDDDEYCDDCPYLNQCNRVLHPGDPGYDDSEDDEEEKEEEVEDEEEEDEDEEDDQDEGEVEDEEDDEGKEEDERTEKEGKPRPQAAAQRS